MESLAKISLNVEYVANSNVSGHTLDIYEPANSSPGKSLFPLVIYIHGGGWTERDKKDYAHIGEQCAADNLCCAILNYRLSPLEVSEGSEDHFKHPEHTNDCALAFQYLYYQALQYCYDTSRVVVVGHSAGGFMAALLQFEDKFRDIWIRNGNGLQIRHWIGLQGIYDLPTILSDFGSDYLRYMIAPAFGWDPEVHKSASPSTVISNLSITIPEQQQQQDPNKSSIIDSKITTPWTIIWSNKDNMVNRRQSEEFEQALQKIQVPAVHLILEPDNDSEGSHHGVTQRDGFLRYIMPIILSITSKL